MGVGERSEALPNRKAMGEKMPCPPREPSSHSLLLNPTSIKPWGPGLSQPCCKQHQGPRQQSTRLWELGLGEGGVKSAHFRWSGPREVGRENGALGQKDLGPKSLPRPPQTNWKAS